MTALVIVVWVLASIFGAVIGDRKGYPVWGFFMGLVLSWLGVVVLLMWHPSHAVMVRREQERLRVQREARSREVS